MLSHTSAALEHGWEVVHAPDRPHALVRRGRHLTAEQRAGARVHVGQVSVGELRRRVVDLSRALDQCLRTLPLPEALAVADSALRHGVDASLLRGVADAARVPARGRSGGSGLADARAANPFESALRAICAQVEGLAVEPQREIAEPGPRARPDLVDDRLRILVEADSFVWHGSRSCRNMTSSQLNRSTSGVLAQRRQRAADRPSPRLSRPGAAALWSSRYAPGLPFGAEREP